MSSFFSRSSQHSTTIIIYKTCCRSAARTCCYNPLTLDPHPYDQILFVLLKESLQRQRLEIAYATNQGVIVSLCPLHSITVLWMICFTSWNDDADRDNADRRQIQVSCDMTAWDTINGKLWGRSSYRFDSIPEAFPHLKMHVWQLHVCFLCLFKTTLMNSMDCTVKIYMMNFEGCGRYYRNISHFLTWAVGTMKTSDRVDVNPWRAKHEKRSTTRAMQYSVWKHVPDIMKIRLSYHQPHISIITGLQEPRKVGGNNLCQHTYHQLRS